MVLYYVSKHGRVVSLFEREQCYNQLSLYSLFEHFGSIIKIEKDRPVFSEGERSEEVYFIQSGSVRISKDTESGRILTLRISGAHNFHR